ncbi:MULTISPECIES: Imm1 family immunity protein [unclassified Spirillospora]|uniref:Imm1 family immunity protein n=1 Tax=unclassified Spirillospora TaxID=2642701 RepID=UPI003711FEB6
MLVLHAFFRGQVLYSLTGTRLDRLIGDILGTASRSDFLSGVESDIFATFVLAAPHRNPAKVDREFDSYLQVMVNRHKTHGALKWLLPVGSVVSVEEYLANNIWLSDNPEPPSADPLIVADMDNGRTLDPRCALPISTVRIVVEEFCRLRTGKRPESISWVPGEFSGRRLDGEQAITGPRYCEDPWCQVSDLPHIFH